MGRNIGIIQSGICILGLGTKSEGIYPHLALFQSFEGEDEVGEIWIHINIKNKKNQSKFKNHDNENVDFHTISQKELESKWGR